jgi:hypothetical protein
VNAPTKPSTSRISARWYRFLTAFSFSTDTFGSP